MDSIVDELRLLAPGLTRLPAQMESSYDEEADVLYVKFEDGVADDSDFTDDDIVLRYLAGRLIGATILHASKRSGLRIES